MAVLSKEDAKNHREACALVALDRDLTEDERDIVLRYWQESSNVTNKLDGAFFTPEALAYDLQFHVHGDRIIDLCAGIGTLAYCNRELYARRPGNSEGKPPREIVCVEKNPAYVEVGRKLLPEATWICADVLDVPGMGLGTFDTAIANPPFGRITRSGNAPGYTGPYFEYHAIAVASLIARNGAFIIPDMSAPFRHIGRPGYRNLDRHESARYNAFHRQTGIVLRDNVGIDASMYEGWRGVSPHIEVVACDFEEEPPKALADERPRPQRAACPAKAAAPVPVAAPRVAVPAQEAEPSEAHSDGFLF
ncbi:class I SAM-dependent methyltransferase [Streptomyces anthocyanicus]|uniref:methyltransferase n=1 Tax=Streptomyces anthocyanicus TaxID=68174 RepID=UPI0037F3EF91